jgi:hypothetical protein
MTNTRWRGIVFLQFLGGLGLAFDGWVVVVMGGRQYFHTVFTYGWV